MLNSSHELSKALDPSLSINIYEENLQVTHLTHMDKNIKLFSPMKIVLINTIPTASAKHAVCHLAALGQWLPQHQSNQAYLQDLCFVPWISMPVLVPIPGFFDFSGFVV